MFDNVVKKVQGLSGSQIKIIISGTLILGITLLSVGTLALIETNEGLNRSLVHSSEGESSIVISVQQDHTYDVKIKITATGLVNGTPISTKTSAIAAFFMNGHYAYERFLYDDNYDEENPGSLEDSIDQKITPLTNYDLNILLHDIDADYWQIKIYRDKPTNLGIIGILGVLTFSVGIISSIIGIGVIVFYLRR